MGRCSSHPMRNVKNAGSIGVPAIHELIETWIKLKFGNYHVSEHGWTRLTAPTALSSPAATSDTTAAAAVPAACVVAAHPPPQAAVATAASAAAALLHAPEERLAQVNRCWTFSIIFVILEKSERLVDWVVWLSGLWNLLRHRESLHKCRWIQGVFERDIVWLSSFALLSHQSVRARNHCEVREADY